ncbi:MAG: hypothetical protein PHG83_00610 [Patescibacteria group bacterium]|nr:hypothetical protein [Patescibacteria group bacterium]
MPLMKNLRMAILASPKKIEDYAIDKRMPIEIKPEILWQAKESLSKEYTNALKINENDYAEELKKCAAIYGIIVENKKS